MIYRRLRKEQPFLLSAQIKTRKITAIFNPKDNKELQNKDWSLS